MKALLRSALVLTMIVTALNVSAQPPQGRGQRQQMTPEERAKQRVEQLKKELSLTETQEKQVYDLQLKMATEMQAMRGEGQQMDREKMTAQMEKRQKEESAAMEGILTKEQFEKWQKQQSERRNNMRGSGQGRQDRQGGQDNQNRRR